jgi:hypothetical protein
MSAVRLVAVTLCMLLLALPMLRLGELACAQTGGVASSMPAEDDRGDDVVDAVKAPRPSRQEPSAPREAVLQAVHKPARPVLCARSSAPGQRADVSLVLRC